MSFTKRLKSWFFRAGASINPNVLDEDGNATLRDNLANRGAPTQSTFQDLTASAAFFTESGDRARSSVAGAIENEVGLVTIAPDSDVTNAGTYVGNTGLEADRTKVVHAAQLSTVAATESQDITGDIPFSDVALEVTVDASTTTRNNFLGKLSTTFLAWLQSLVNQVNTNVINITTNAADIITNAGNIANNTSDISTNATNIATNATNIDANTTNINNVSGGTLDVKESNTTVENPVNVMNFDGNDFNVQTFATGQVVITTNAQAPPSYNWASLSGGTGNLQSLFVSGTGGAPSVVDDNGSIRYVIMDKTMFLSVSISFRIFTTASRGGSDFADLRINIPGGTANITTNQSMSTFSLTGAAFATQNLVDPVQVASDAAGNYIYGLQSLPLFPGSGNTPIYTIRGMIAIEIA